MDHPDFAIDRALWCSNRRLGRTDIGRRFIVAIGVDETTVRTLDSTTRIETVRTLSAEEAQQDGWFNGRPYTVANRVFDEHDLEGRTPTRERQYPLTSTTVIASKANQPRGTASPPHTRDCFAALAIAAESSRCADV